MILVSIHVGILVLQIINDMVHWFYKKNGMMIHEEGIKERGRKSRTWNDGTLFFKHLSL